MSKQYQLLQSTSAAVDLVSTPIDINDLFTVSLQVAFTGTTLVGTLTCEGSVNGVDFFTYPGSTQAVTAATGHIYDIAPTGVRSFRVRWDYTSGTGNMTVVAFLKGPGKAG